MSLICCQQWADVSSDYLYELVLQLFKIAAIFCQARCDSSGVGIGTCPLTDDVPSR